MKRRLLKDPPGLTVLVHKNNIDNALSRFKNKVKDSGLMMESRDRAFYEKPSAAKRKKINAAKRRNKK